MYVQPWWKECSGVDCCGKLESGRLTLLHRGSVVGHHVTHHVSILSTNLWRSRPFQKAVSFTASSFCRNVVFCQRLAESQSLASVGNTLKHTSGGIIITRTTTFVTFKTSCNLPPCVAEHPVCSVLNTDNLDYNNCGVGQGLYHYKVNIVTTNTIIMRIS